jgi:hypothetical protein
MPNAVAEAGNRSGIADVTSDFAKGGLEKGEGRLRDHNLAVGRRPDPQLVHVRNKFASRLIFWIFMRSGAELLVKITEGTLFPFKSDFDCHITIWLLGGET